MRWILPSFSIMARSVSRGTSPGSSSYKDEKLIYPAATRNKEPILDVLKKQLPYYFSSFENVSFLEISSGSGQHVAHFAPHFPEITFQPSEYSEDTLGSIGVYAKECLTGNIKQPLLIDITEDLSNSAFQENSIDIMYCSNMIHVAPFECATGLFKNAGKYLKPQGLMITYGPYAVNGVISPDSNVNFNNSLKLQNPLWGIRCINVLESLGGKHGLLLRETFEMPANNKCLIWQKKL